MTLLTKGVRYYLRCSSGHKFERAKSEMSFCPKCGMPVRLYGLKDSSSYAEDDAGEMEDLQGT